MDGCTDGTWRERRYFTCPYGRGFFCPYNSLSPDRRFDASENTCGADPAVNRKEQNLFFFTFKQFVICNLLVVMCWLHVNIAVLQPLLNTQWKSELTRQSSTTR